METVLGLYSFDPFPGAIEKNAKRMVQEIHRARAAGVEILVFPEMALPGYCIGDLHASPAFLEKQERILRSSIAPATEGITVVLGKTVQDSNYRMPSGAVGRFNGYAVLQNGALLHEGKKTLLANEGVLEDSRYFLLGDPEEIRPVHLTLADGKSLNLGVLVCQDLWDDHTAIHPAQLQRERGADLLVVLNSSPFHYKKEELRRETAQRRTRETGLPLYYVNTTGIQDIGKNIVIFDGACFALTPNLPTPAAPPFSEELLKVPYCSSWNSPPLPPHSPPQPSVERLAQALIYAVRQFFERTGQFGGALIGLSGGIDSAVDALLVARAIGPDRLHCLNMPSRHNSTTTKSIAAAIASRLGCTYRVHPIEETIALKSAALAQHLGRPLKGITLENMQARARGNLLMEYAQELGLMVVGNGNKTEFQRGYATLYGDILGGLMPLGDVPKQLVFDLGRHLDPQHQIIPEELYTLPPSAELSTDQNVDQGSGDPFDYSLESPMGVELLENGRTPRKLAQRFAEQRLDPQLWRPDAQGRTCYDKLSAKDFEEYAKEVSRAIRGSYFKRVQAPPIPVVSPRAFGLDYRESLFPPDLME